MEIHRTPFPVNFERKKSSKPGHFFHSDISGPFQSPSYRGHRYFIRYKDDHSGFRFIFFLKDRQDIITTFQSLYRLVKNETGNRIQKL